MDNTLRVLQVEDSVSDAALIARMLQRAGYDVCAGRVEDTVAMRAALLQESGFDIPFIVVSGMIGEDVAVRMIKAGADEYLMKDNLTRLTAAVAHEVADARVRLENIEGKRIQQELREGQEKLRAANRELDRKVEELKQALADKNVLLREVQHRVKNNLQVISSLLSLQAGELEARPGQVALARSRDRVRSMALVHEQLCYSGHLAQIDFGPYIDRLGRYLLDGYLVGPGRIQVCSETDVTLNLDDAVPCGLLVQELLSNSLKHAFPNETRGEIHIQFHQQNGEYHFLYRDTGVGLPPGFEFSKTQSLGTQLISHLTNQLGGTGKFFNSGGARFQLTFAATKPPNDAGSVPLLPA